MKLAEDQAKAVLSKAGIAIPAGIVVNTPQAAAQAAIEVGPRVAVKALVRSGGRGKQGGVLVVDGPEQASHAAGQILGLKLGDEIVTSVLVEQAVDIGAEHYLSVTIDPSSGRPMIMRSEQGGMEVEAMTDQIESIIIEPGDLTEQDVELSEIEATLLTAFSDLDALLIEINPLVHTTGGEVIAVDAKIELDDSAAYRHQQLHASIGTQQAGGTERERQAAEIGLRLIELDGDIAVLANGAGLTMATMDAIVAVGGAPANFLEIGGDAYTKATPALELVLSQPGIRSLLVNFCGAFARCDVMTAGVIEAWKTLKPDIPVVFSISGTGMDQANEMVRTELGIEPHPTMADAVVAVVQARTARSES